MPGEELPKNVYRLPIDREVPAVDQPISAKIIRSSRFGRPRAEDAAEHGGKGSHELAKDSLEGHEVLWMIDICRDYWGINDQLNVAIDELWQRAVNDFANGHTIEELSPTYKAWLECAAREILD